VLTPKPNTIPTDGSTVEVYLDGVNIGNPGYNIYREDIASLFPGYNNSNGAVGKFYLDTTNYANGVHTIQWKAVDDAGNADGIGSRYFSIQNAGSSHRNSNADSQWLGCPIEILSKLPDDYSKPLTVVKRFSNMSKSLKIISTGKDMNEIETKELSLLEVRLGTPLSKISGYMVRGNRIGAMPIGSTLKKGVFYWSPGPGFYGRYRLLFIVAGQNGMLCKKYLTVNIKPLSSGK
jgi:hypothetical protein